MPFFDTKFKKEKFSISKLHKCAGKEASFRVKREKLLKRQRKAQKKFHKTMMNQRNEREKQLYLLKRAACCQPPTARNLSPSESPPQFLKECTKKLWKQQLLSSLKKVASRLTPTPNPCPPNSSPSNPPQYPSNPPPGYPPPCPPSKEPPYTTRFIVSSVSCCSSEHDQCLAQEMRKQDCCNSHSPKVTCLCSSEPINAECKFKKPRGEARNLCGRCIICCVFLSIICGCTGYAIPILAGVYESNLAHATGLLRNINQIHLNYRIASCNMDERRWSLSTCAQCDFCFEPPKLSTSTLQRQTPCLGLDKLIQEERDNQEWNVAFQKALVKRLEASERRITLDDYLDDDDDGGGGGSRGKRKRKDKKEKKTVTEEPKTKTAETKTTKTAKKKAKTENSSDELPEAKEVFKEKKCPCSSQVKREERKRKTFVKIMEREQIRFEKRSLRAQRKYDKERQKAYKRCELTQLAAEKGYFKRNKDGVVDKAEETFSVFIHMDPAQCACRGKAARIVKCKKCFFKCCVWLYVLGFITFFVTSYFLTKL